MSQYFWIEVAVCALGAVAAIGVMKTKTAGWGPQSLSALSLVLGIPVLAILGLEKILDSQAIAALLGATVGFGAGKATKA